MEQGIYIFENETDFLNAIDELTHHYENKPKNIYLSKWLISTSELKKEIAYLDKCKVNAFSGFKKAKQIKINVTDCLSVTYCITYNFNCSNGGIYNKFNRYLRKRNRQYIWGGNNGGNHTQRNWGSFYSQWWVWIHKKDNPNKWGVIGEYTQRDCTN